MTKKELKLIQPLLSPAQYRVATFLHHHQKQWASYKEINAATGQTCCWKRLSEMDKLYEQMFSKRDQHSPEEQALGRVYFRRHQWKEDLNRYEEAVRYKQFQLGR